MRISIDTERTPLVERTLDIIGRRISERGGVLEEASSAEVVFDILPAVGAEAFRIAREGDAWRITGGDERGLLYGAGKFLRGCRLRGAEFDYAGHTGDFVPKLPVRGMYFATHFHNFYHDAPLEMVQRYVEDLALWGCNALSVWFDMHHYTGIDDPAAQTMIARLHAILRTANSVGMGAGLTTLANEAYNTSPLELRAEPFPAHYHVEICPSRAGGLELILRWREEMLHAFADLAVEYFWIWPYDQGGCKCEACKPWGGHGFVRNGEAVGRLAHRLLPGVKNVVSCWEFGYWEGDAEWEQFYAAMAAKPDWVDYYMAEGHGDYPPYILQHGPPPHFPLLNFPEISMSGMLPWGGFGANLQPVRLQKVWDSAQRYLSGGFPYSEGIFEDLNKAICLQLYWDPARPVKDIVCEYAAELAPQAIEEITEAVYLLEANMQHCLTAEEQRQDWLRAYERNDAGAADYRLYQLDALHDAERPLALLNAAAATMTPLEAAAWRWRFLWLRAALDAELARNEGKPGAQTDAWFEEIARISHAEDAEWSVCAPSRRLLARAQQPERAKERWM